MTNDLNERSQDKQRPVAKPPSSDLRPIRGTSRGSLLRRRSGDSRDPDDAGGLSDGSRLLALGLLAKVLIEAAQGWLSSEGKWITNEKRLIEAAGLSRVETDAVDRVDRGDSICEIANYIAGTLGLTPFTPR